VKQDDLITNLKLYFLNVKKIYDSINLISGDNVYSEEVKKAVTNLSREWFSVHSPEIKLYDIDINIRKKYDDIFSQLLLLSSKVSRKRTYLNQIENLNSWREDLLLPISRYNFILYQFSEIETLLQKIDPIEREYLEESLLCAKRGYFRAAVILGWCSAVSRIHIVVNKLGIDVFNKKSEEMFNIKTGRYKRFS
jgi:hypothetical protein